jgi:hypothetical protein
LASPFRFSLHSRLSHPDCHNGGADERSLPLSERDTTGQLIGDIDEVIAVVTELVNGSIDWAEACNRLKAYDGVQDVDA